MSYLSGRASEYVVGGFMIKLYRIQWYVQQPDSSLWCFYQLKFQEIALPDVTSPSNSSL